MVSPIHGLKPAPEQTAKNLLPVCKNRERAQCLLIASRPFCRVVVSLVGLALLCSFLRLATVHSFWQRRVFTPWDELAGPVGFFFG